MRRLWWSSLILYQQKTPAVTIFEHHSRLVTLVLRFPGGFTRHEHQADGPDKEETGVHGPPPIKQICSWCLLVTIFVIQIPSYYQEYLV